MSNHPAFPAIVAHARQADGLTAAQMDHSLATGDGIAMVALAAAAYRIANERHPAVRPGDGAEFVRERQARADALIDATTADRDAMVAAAKAKSYTGWSTESRGSIRYAR